MAIPSWPGSVPYKARRSGYSVSEPYRPPVTTEVEDGPDLMRAATQTVIPQKAMRLRLTNAQRDTFAAFVRDDLVQGTRQFTMQVLVDSTNYASRRVYLVGGKYAEQPRGRDWDVTFTLAVFPS